MVFHHPRRPGPSLITSSDRISQRTILPVNTASINGNTRISNTPAANTKAFHGVGGGKAEGIAMARNSCFSNRSFMRS